MPFPIATGTTAREFISNEISDYNFWFFFRSNKKSIMITIRNNVFLLQTWTGIVKENLYNISFIEACEKHIIVHLTNNEKLESPASLKVLTSALPEKTFYHCHRKFIVNMKEIKKYNQKASELILQCGNKIPISRDRKKDFHEKWIKII
jgi:DNA-binding LytR/AlgR family response regulator